MPDDTRTVAVIIPCYNQAHFLADALESVIAQTRLPNEIVVVDDGSVDDPAIVVARFPGVRLIRQKNAGLAAARNVGLAAIQSTHVAFLDADDALTPDAIALNLAELSRHPEAAMAFGAYDMVDANLRHRSGPHFRPVPAQAANAMLIGNPVAMHATVLYVVDRLREAGAFDPALKSCEDYDTYIRMARRWPVACHPRIVALYRIHGSNMSGNPAMMLHWSLAVLDRYRPAASDGDAMSNWREARRYWKRHYSRAAINSRSSQGVRSKLSRVLFALRNDPGATLARFSDALAHRWRRHQRRRPSGPRLGTLDMGMLENAEPVSRCFGYDRGTPIDRAYIEDFLNRCSGDIAGRVLEIGDASYCRRFGTGITRQDVLHISPEASEATIIGDLSQPGILPEAAFDCMVITQTLHLLIDVRAAIVRLHAALKPGGALLLTVPGISPIDQDDWGSSWYWSMTGQSVTRLFGEIFGQDAIAVEVHGNVYAATCFLQGLALEEVRKDLLEVRDPCFPVVVAVRARRAD